MLTTTVFYDVFGYGGLLKKVCDSRIVSNLGAIVVTQQPNSTL